MAVTWLYMAAAALGGAGMLWHEMQRHKEDQDDVQTKQASSKARRKKVLPVTSAAVSDIPPHELQQLQTFLHKVYRWRGWQGGPFHVRQAWHAAELAAETAAGGSWLHDFELVHMTDAKCDALLNVIDECFFGKKLIKYLATKMEKNHHRHGSIAPGQHNQSSGSSTTGAGSSTTRVSCKVVNWNGPTDTWLSYFDECNVIHINAWRWVRKLVAPDDPLNCEGVVCSNRLQMLLHTLAHELVHAVVFHVFPEMDKSSPAYLANDRHGPIFQLLNKQLFGHSSDALERVQLLECTH